MDIIKYLSVDYNVKVMNSNPSITTIMINDKYEFSWKLTQESEFDVYFRDICIYNGASCLGGVMNCIINRLETSAISDDVNRIRSLAFELAFADSYDDENRWKEGIDKLAEFMRNEADMENGMFDAISTIWKSSIHSDKDLVILALELLAEKYDDFYKTGGK